MPGRLVWRLLILLLAVSFVPSCNSASEPEETVLTIWGLAITPDEKGNDLLVRKFEEENPGVRVQLLSMGAGGMNPQKLMTAIVGNVAPDIVRQDRFTIADWASRGAFQPLDEWIERDKNIDPRTPLPDQYYEAAWEETRYGGQTYGIPFRADNRVLYWNTRIFRQEADKLRAAGLDPTRAPRTWEETLKYSEVLTEFNADGSLKRAGFIPNFGNSWLYMYAFQSNASFLSSDGTRATLDTPQARRALQFMVDGYDILGGYDNAKTFQDGFRSGENDPLGTDQVALVINGDWQIANYSRFTPKAEFAAAPAPVPEERYEKLGEFTDEPDQYITWSGGFAYCIPRGAKNADLAWKFIKWVSSTEARKMYIDAQADLERSRGRRYIPPMDAQIETNEWIRDTYASGDSMYDQALRTHIEMMPFARMRPATFAGQTLWDEHIRVFERACRKEVSIPVALQEGSQRVQVVLDEFNDREQYPVIDIAVPVGIGVASAVVGLTGWIFWMIRRGEGRVNKTETRAGYLFISPWIVGFLIFTLGPMVASLVFAFMQYDVLNEARYVGLKNFDQVFQVDWAILKKSLLNVGYLGLIGIPLGLTTGLTIALLLNRGVKGIRFYRTAFYLPSITPAVASTFLWWWILVPDNTRGLLNNTWSQTIGVWFGTASPGWLTVEAWAKPGLILMGLWGAGGGMILWLAGLKGVPQTLYEAASIDGASPWKQFVRITLPQLSPLIFFNSVVALIAVLQTFDSVYIITRGENYGASDGLATPVYMLFNNGFSYFRMGYASAIAWLLFIIVLVLTATQFIVSKRWVYSEAQAK